INFDSHATARRHFGARAGEPRGAHVLNRDDGAGAHSFETRFEQQLFHERIADLHVRPLLLRFLAEFGGGEQRSAVNAVAARLCARVDHRVALSLSARKKEIFPAADAERERVDQRIIRIARLEDDFAAHGRNAEAIPVKRNPAYDAIQNPAITREFLRSGVRSGRAGRHRAKPQRIEHGDGPRAHSENVAQNPADARRRALKWLDEAGMIVRFDFEDGNQAIADINDAGVFSRALNDVLAARRQAFQMDPRGFVRAVFAPTDAEYAQLSEIRIAPQNFLDSGVFLRREAVFGGDLRRDFNFGVEHRERWRKNCPSKRIGAQLSERVAREAISFSKLMALASRRRSSADRHFSPASLPIPRIFILDILPYCFIMRRISAYCRRTSFTC